ncbi:hypothetical protein [Eleftheria terrae]|uniref:hypothetical protein n=1 Tax=Eleftheria terrae TaxID=1597781 RepID=UPI00263B8E10|nr:hypothetical protein [Eleftheria terrae]WKB51698.1 hypothetical protein N7L95_18115 [Eleftheria terrae]
MSYSIQTKLGDLLDNEQTRAILEKNLPGLSGHPQIAMARGFPLATVAQFSGGLITQDMLDAVEGELSQLA